MRQIEVETGRVRTAAGRVELRCAALGSCVAVAAVDAARGIGGIAHVMLPGRPGGRAKARNRYAEPAVSALVRNLRMRGARVPGMVVCLAGGGNVLKNKNDTLCRDIVRSVEHALAGMGLTPVRRAVRGTQRRSIMLNTETGTVCITTGDGDRRILYEP